MELPAPFENVFEQWQHLLGHQVMQRFWTTPLQRHVGAYVHWDGEPAFAKLALARQRDLDEPDMLEGLRREVWWSRAIERLLEHDSQWPFRSPRVLATNVCDPGFDDEVAWVVFEQIRGEPILPEDFDYSDKSMSKADEALFDELTSAIIDSLLALDQVQPHTLVDLGMPLLPSPPHGMRRWRRKGLLDMKTAVLGNGAFEIKNFWRDQDGRLVIMDNEFAGWYPKYDHLAYLYHRLYCNTLRPDLAKRLLSKYFWRIDLPDIFAGALEQGGEKYARGLHAHMTLRGSFRDILSARLRGGWYYDTVRRKLPPWHKKQRLRYALMLTLWLERYEKLYS